MELTVPTPFRLGLDAYREGIPLEACPDCFHGYAAEAWHAGWLIGQRIEAAWINATLDGPYWESESGESI